MTYSKAIEAYSRWEIELDDGLGVNRIRIHTPDGHADFAEVFEKQPVDISYDEHGYEQIRETGKTICCARLS